MHGESVSVRTLVNGGYVLAHGESVRAHVSGGSDVRALCVNGNLLELVCECAIFEGSCAVGYVRVH